MKIKRSYLIFWSRERSGEGGSGISCCRNGEEIPNTLRHPECFPIELPRNDPIFSRLGEFCMEFARSLPAPRPQCNFGPREQVMPSKLTFLISDRFSATSIQQYNHIVDRITSSHEHKQYCCGVFLDETQDFDRERHQGLLWKFMGILPSTYYLVQMSYLSKRFFPSPSRLLIITSWPCEGRRSPRQYSLTTPL